MKNFTVIFWATDSYLQFANGLIDDCKRLGYPFHLYHLDESYSSLVRAWTNHPKIIRKGVNDFGTVLFLDVECRILKAIPNHWQAPLISVRKPAQKFWIRFNSGTVLVDESCISWVDSWQRIVDFWQMGDLDNQDFIHWPGDLCDELALSAALAAHNVEVSTVDLEYVDRNSTAEIARGLWRNNYTILQHPTVHHWPNEFDLIECKKLFWQNYPNDPNEGNKIFSKCSGLTKAGGWVFNTKTREYAPEEFWEDQPRKWG